MKVRIFKNMACENNPSMHLYAQELLASMPQNVDSFSIEGKNLPVIKYYFAKEFLYPRIAAGNQADVNHISDHSYAGLLETLEPARTIVTCHDLIPLLDKNSASFLGRKRFLHNIKYLSKAKKIITASDFTRQSILKIFSNISEKDIEIIPYGINDIFKVSDNKDALRSKYNINKKSILHVGSSYHRKNIWPILNILQEKKDLQFVKVGLFDKKQISFIKNKKLEKRIIYIPRINMEERYKLMEIYNSVGCLVYPSFFEGFGMPVLEAFACGCPVACSDIAPFLEIAKDAAVFFNPNDKTGLSGAIDKILGDKTLTDAIIQKGISLSEKYTWQDCAQKTYKIYEEIYNSKDYK